jgi:hypothetical protein
LENFSCSKNKSPTRAQRNQAHPSSNQKGEISPNLVTLDATNNGMQFFGGENKNFLSTMPPKGQKNSAETQPHSHPGLPDFS